MYLFIFLFLLKILTPYLNLFISLNILNFKDIIFIIYNNYIIFESPERLKGVIINLKDFNLKEKEEFRFNIPFLIFNFIIIDNFIKQKSSLRAGYA